MFETISNAWSLFAILIGLILCFSYYVSHVRREYQLLAGYLLGDFLSSYYWTVYLFVMRDDPDSSALMAYFGWNVGYVMMLLLVLHIGDKQTRKYFHPLMLVPVPLNIAQFLLYIQYGGYFNNAWQGIFCTAIAVCSLQGILYRRKHREQADKKTGIYVVTLLFVVFQYTMFTASCFDWPSEMLDPYHYAAILCYAMNVLLPVVIARAFGDSLKETGTTEASNFRSILRVIFVAMVCGISFVGYYVADWLQRRLLLPESGKLQTDSAAQIIMVVLFVISVALSVLVVTIMAVLSGGQKAMEKSGLMTQPDGETEPLLKGSNPDKKETGTDTGSRKSAIMKRWNLILPLLITFFLMSLIVFYTSSLIYRISVVNIHESGTDKVNATAVQLENYINTAKSVLWVTADSVDHLTRNGSRTSQILDYMVEETANQADKFDENFTGIYGFVRGKYLDGLGWVPPEDYDPKSRDWYRIALEAGGDVAIVPPYVDMQTGSVVISICKALQDGESVLALDLIINYIQTVTEEVNVNGMGHGLVLDEEGTVIAHIDAGENGLDIKTTEYGEELIRHLAETGSGYFEMEMEGEQKTVFCSDVMNQWSMLIIIDNNELFGDVKRTLAVNIVTFLVVFILISFFYVLAYRNEERSNREAEALRIREQQQTYEAEILRLEKSTADRANQAKSNFLADMSHEIRTPINAVLGMNEMILRESTNESITTYARNLESAGKNLLSIINDILDFSKIEAGKMEIVEAPYRLSSVLNDVSNMIVFRARSKDLAFHVEVDETIPDYLQGDEVRVRQVITNILTNAVKYTDEGSVRLVVKKEEEGGKKVTLSFAAVDTGIGIKPEDIEKLFSKFERVDLEKNKTVEGTGLGLAITKRLVEMMHGEIHLESEYGKGSVFTITLPQTVMDEAPIGNFREAFRKSMEQSKAYRESFRAPEARVLVVDDTPLNLVVITGFLKTTQIQLDTASGGKEALKLTAQKQYDLILMDQRMPEMDGTQTLQHIREQENGCNRNTDVICLTADAVQGARERYLAEGFTDYLSKPVESHSLEETLVKYLPPEKVIRVTEENAAGTDADRQEARTAGTDEIQAEGLLREIYGNIGALHFEEAMKHSTSEEMLEKILRMFYESLQENAEQIKRFADEGDYENYTIKVHALKSSARLIGATELSELARKLEETGNRMRAGEDAQAFEREMTPKLLSDMSELEKALEPYFKQDEADAEVLPEISQEELDELYESVLEFAEMFDQDGIKRLLAQAEGYALPEGERERFARLKKCAQSSDWSGLKEALDASCI